MDIPAAVATCGRTRQGLAPLPALVRAGVDRRRLVEHADVVRVRPRVYAMDPLPPWPQYVVTPEGLAPDHLAQVRAVLLSLGLRATASGRTAACLRGWQLLVEPARTVEVAVPHGRARTKLPHVRCRQRRSIPRELLCVVPGQDWLWVTTAIQTALDCLLELPLIEAVVAVDSALRAKDVTLAELAAAVAALPGRREAAKARRALELCDAASGSVLESVLRVRMLQADIGGFTCQRVLTGHDGRYVLRVDFCFEAARLVVEADGARWHQDGLLDRGTDNELAAAGWRVLRFTWAEVLHESERVLALIRAACGAPARTGDIHLAPPTAAAA